MDAHLFTWIKSLKLEENKKSKFKNSKKKKVWIGFEPPPSLNMFSSLQFATIAPKLCRLKTMVMK